MGNVGAWQSPFPLRLGGNGHVRVKDMYDELNANIGTGIATDAGSIDDVETRSVARALAIADRAIDRRVAQIDLTKLSTLLARWEGILGIVPTTEATRADRARAVAARMASGYSSVRSGLARIAETAFAPWTTQLHFVSDSDAVKNWPAGAGDEAVTDWRFWFSTVAHFVVEYVRPAGATDDEVTSRRNACLEALEEYAAGWAAFDLSETQEGNPHGFVCDYPNLDVAAFSE